MLQAAGQGTLFRPKGPVFGGFTDLLFYPAFQFIPDRGFQAQPIQMLMNLFPEETEVKGLEVEFFCVEEASIQGPENEAILLPGRLWRLGSSRSGRPPTGPASCRGLRASFFYAIRTAWPPSRLSTGPGFKSRPFTPLRGLNKKPRPAGVVFYISNVFESTGKVN